MKRQLIYFFGFLLFISSILGCSKREEVLVVATYTYSTNNRIANLQPFSDYLSQELNREVETKSYPDVDALIAAVKAQKVDVAFINTFGYLLLALDNEVATPTTALKVKTGASDNYKTILLAKKSLGLESLSSLQEKASGLKISLVNKGSTSGNLVPRLLLSSLGIDKPEDQFDHLSYAGDHTKSFESLISSEVDIAAVGSSEYFKQMEENPELSETIQPIWISEEIPLGPVMIKNTLSKELTEEITQLLLSLDSTSPDVIESIKNGWSEAKQAEKFIPINDSHYDSFRRFENKDADLQSILNKFRQ